MRDHVTTYREIADLLDDLPIALRTVRRSRGLSLREVARQTGISFSTVLRIEAGEGCHLDNVLAILRWLDAPASTGGAA